MKQLGFFPILLLLLLRFRTSPLMYFTSFCVGRDDRDVYFYLHNNIIAGRPARPRPTALLSPSSDSKPETATAVVVAPDDGHEGTRNMLNSI